MAEQDNTGMYQRSWTEILEACEDLEDVNTESDVKFRARYDYEFFLSKVLGFRTDNELIQDAIETIQNPPEQPTNKIKKIARLAPRGHSKTYSWTVGQSLWRAFKERGTGILIISSTDDQAKGILGEIKKFIKRNDALEHLQPTTDFMDEMEDSDSVDIDKDDSQWAAKNITTTTDVTIRARPFTSKIRSKHIEYVLADDLLDDEDSRGNTVEKDKNIYYQAITPAVESQGEWIQVVGTPQSHGDLMMELVHDKDSYDSETYQAYDPETGEVLWEYDEETKTGWTVQQLENKKVDMGGSRFASEYMCSPMSVDDRYFEEKTHIQPNIDTENYEEVHWKPNTSNEFYNDWHFVLGVDLALQDGPQADHTVFTVLGVDPRGKAWLCDIWRNKGNSPKGIAKKLQQFDDRYDFREGLIEKNAIGEGVWKTILERCPPGLTNRVTDWDTTRKTRPKILSTLQAALERGALVLHEHEALIDELKHFHLNSKGKLVGKDYDDCVMSLAIAWWQLDDEEFRSTEASVSLIGMGGGEKSFTVGDDEESEERIGGEFADVGHGIV